MPRPADKVAGLSDEVQNLFSSLCEVSRAYLQPNGRLKFNQQPTFQYIPDAWDALKSAGLIEYQVDTTPATPPWPHGDTHVYWNITDEGWAARDDYLKQIVERHPLTAEQTATFARL